MKQIKSHPCTSFLNGKKESINYYYLIFTVSFKNNNCSRKLFNCVQCPEETIFYELLQLNNIEIEDEKLAIQKLVIDESEHFDYLFIPVKKYMSSSNYFEARRLKHHLY